MNVFLGYNFDGKFLTTLPEGPAYDNNKIYLSIRIIDDTGGYLCYNLSQPVQVYQDYNVTAKMVTDIISAKTSSSLNRILFNGNSQNTAKLIITLSSLLNAQSLIDKKAVSGNKTLLSDFGPHVNMKFNFDFNQINFISPDYVGVKM